MKIFVYLRDGRTVYLIEKRGRLKQLVNVEPWHEQESVPVVRGIWNPERGEYEWERARVRFIAKASISVVEECRGIHDPVLRSAEARSLVEAAA